MTAEPGWIPPRIDKTEPNIVRVYDWWLGETITSSQTEWRPEPGTLLPSAAEVGTNGAVARKP